jgi:hypothetical protein
MQHAAGQTRREDMDIAARQGRRLSAADGEVTSRKRRQTHDTQIVASFWPRCSGSRALRQQADAAWRTGDPRPPRRARLAPSTATLGGCGRQDHLYLWFRVHRERTPLRRQYRNERHCDRYDRDRHDELYGIPHAGRRLRLCRARRVDRSITALPSGQLSVNTAIAVIGAGASAPALRWSR